MILRLATGAGYRRVDGLHHDALTLLADVHTRILPEAFRVAQSALRSGDVGQDQHRALARITRCTRREALLDRG